MKYRYEVVSTWGNAPQVVIDLIGKPDGFLVYDQYLGLAKAETLVDLRTGHVTGGWTMRYAGRRQAAA